MEDNHIIELFFKRDEQAIRETSNKYGVYLRKIADNILKQPEEAEECVSDTYLRAWDSIPPTKPNKLSVYLAGITRNNAIDRYRSRHAAKHGGGMVMMCLDELDECIGENDAPIEDKIVLKNALNEFFKRLNEKQKNIFFLRYYYFMEIEEIAKRVKSSKASVKMNLHRTRANLRKFLEGEGIVL